MKYHFEGRKQIITLKYSTSSFTITNIQLITSKCNLSEIFIQNEAQIQNKQLKSN